MRRLFALPPRLVVYAARMVHHYSTPVVGGGEASLTLPIKKRPRR